MDDTFNNATLKSVRHIYKYELIIIFLATLLMFLIDTLIRDQSMTWSVNIAVYLQKLPLQKLANNIALYFSILICISPLILYLFQGNPKQNLPMILGCLMLVYLSAIAKLIFVSGRPVFYSDKLSIDKCLCD